MNQIPFLDKPDFPLDATVLDSMQTNYNAIAEYFVKFLGVTNGIISGVEKQPDNSYSDGVVIINGELLPFVASVGAFLTVVENEDKVTVASGQYTVLRQRHAEATNVSTSVLITALTRLSLAEYKLFVQNQLSTKATIPANTGGHKYISLSSSNIYVAIDNRDMMVDIDDLKNVIWRGRMVFKYTTVGVFADTWRNLFNINNLTTVAVGKENIIPALPWRDDCMDVYFTGYNEDNPYSLHYFRIRGNGDFDLFTPNSVFIAGQKVRINIMYNNKK